MEYQRRGEQIINPGPDITDLLRLQDVHPSQKVWKNKGGKEHVKVQRSYDFKYDAFDERIKAKLRLAGFETIARLGEGKLDLHFVTALVERWRPETHTFHLPVGEATVTLQDTKIMTGLPVDGMPVTCPTVGIDWFELCSELLGDKPQKEDLIGMQLKHKWLDALISKRFPENANEFEVECRTRAIILRICGGLIYNNKSGNKVYLMPLLLLRDLQNCKQYAWGAALLAFLYRWHFSRYASDAPIHNVSAFRDAIDGQRNDEFIWQPYAAVLHLLQSQYRRGERVWQSEVPIIFFHIVEYHQVDRCMRQFGLDQHIPHEPENLDKLHVEDLRGKPHVDWYKRHEAFIQIWGQRYNRVRMAVPLRRPLSRQSEYMQWYVQHTKRWMTSKGARVPAAGDGIQRIYHTNPGQSSWDTTKDICGSILGGFEEEERLSQNYEAQYACPSQSMSHFPEPVNLKYFQNCNHD